LVPLPVRQDAGSSFTGLTDDVLVHWSSGLLHTVHSVFQEEETFHSLHILLVSQCVITFFGHTSSLIRNLQNHMTLMSLGTQQRRKLQPHQTTWWEKQWEPYMIEWSSAGKMVENISEICSCKK